MSNRKPIRLPPVVVGLAMLAVAIIVGGFFGRGVGFLTGAGLALSTAIWLLWRSIQSLTGDAELSLEEALGLGAPSVEEERKHAVLRALKDLEFEKAVGKISDADYRSLVKKYRADAKRLLNQVDESLTPAREKAEALIEAHRNKAGLSAANGSPNSQQNDAAAQTSEQEKPSAAVEETASKAKQAATDEPETPRSASPSE